MARRRGSGRVNAAPGRREFEAARARIAGRVRRTPMFDPRPHGLALDGGAGGRVLLKLECLQASGSFKARGAMNKLLSLEPEAAKAGCSRRATTQ